MDNGLIPRRYAKALYKFADAHGNTREVYDEMKDVISAFTANPGLQKVLGNPFVSKEDKAQLLKSAAGENVENDYLGFVKLILEQHREDYAYRMALAYRDIYRDINRISQVRITTAVKLGEDELKRIKQMIEAAFPDRKLEYTYNVEPAVIGGFIIDVDDSRMDASLSNELEQLRLNLINS
ncbi:MAG: ATP synthase F1 subunit delta [Muribaculaceae bacterium]|nr:ATP synthase F1 subunit delta [Muribaculaceae bacterium]